MREPAEKFTRRWLSAWIKSSRGFSLRQIGRAGLRYKEGEREMWVDSELQGVNSLIAVFPESIKAWDAPFAEVPVSNDERQRIFDNIRRALESQGFRVVT